ncbi:PAS domain-containing protein [Tardiphaga sp. 20_F10_N6_6]|jgi:PAS domain S-box-containing protein|uniref:PAS domain-containing protein n=1 Tax=Tardiphaga TaxID=1395974 RepID=UPI001586A781|nr:MULTISPECIES: PAS domain-containing protein [Tardiphaga]NUU44393.1 PAS domain-containing protein [Tardiphaga robiniae]UFS77925.1 PAS domain-containing protein [Tardiphaga sp. 37S4]
MIVGRPISEICRELAISAQAGHHTVLAQILRMASLEAAQSGVRHHEGDSSIQDRLVGTWDWDIANDRVYADSKFARLFGVNADLASRGTPLQDWLDAIHPDDIDDVAAAITRSLTTGQVFSREYRVVSHGDTHWVYARGKCTLDSSGKAVRFPGAIVDITREKIDDHHFSIVPT